MPKVKDNELILAIRMCELCRPPTAWNRALWAVSTQTVMREVLEAAQVRRDGILSDAAVSDLQSSASVQIGTDPGAGDAAMRRHLNPYFRANSVITPGSLAAAAIESAVWDLDANYLLRWAAAVDQGVKDEQLEKCARSVISHLLNNGHDPKMVSDHIRTEVLSDHSPIATAGDLIRSLQTIGVKQQAMYKAVFPVESAPLSNKTLSVGWMKGADLIAWMKKEHLPQFQPGERVIGAITFEVSARDHLSAANAAAARFVLIRDRAILGTHNAIKPLGYFWLSGQLDRFKIEPPHRGVEVASLARQDCIYVISHGDPGIERSIALLAELDHGPASAAVTSGWAALESLAMGPAEDGNRVETALRMAALVTASFVRAELTTLAYSYASSNKDKLAADIRASSSNKERTERIMQRLGLMPTPNFGRVEDTAAAKRISQLRTDPVSTLNRVNTYVAAAFIRLYRLRNLVAHGGRTDSVVLEAGLRAAAPLVGAAFDRIHHASASQNIGPVELIAKARLRLDLLDPAQPYQLTSMLE